MTKLNVEWEEFKDKIYLFYSKGKTISTRSPKDQGQFEKFEKDYNEWRAVVLDFLLKSFETNNRYVQAFKASNAYKYTSEVNGKPIHKLVGELKQNLNNKLVSIEYMVNLLSVSDLITKPYKVDVSQREKYTSEEILELILTKLCELYDDNIYPIRPILEGNGITLNRRREEYEYVRVLEGYGFVESNNIGSQADARLTVEGKLYVEEKQKLIKPNYEHLDGHHSDITTKIDKIIQKLEKLGLGQEILYNELDEIKELLPILGKKNLGQLIKGKIHDLILTQIISIDTAKMIYETIVKETLRLP
jgi:hypothetical protein